jgi:hypothetical protein
MSGAIHLLPLYAYKARKRKFYTFAFCRLQFLDSLAFAISVYWTTYPLLLLLLLFSLALQLSAGYASSFTRFRNHTQRHATVSRTPLDE